MPADPSATAARSAWPSRATCAAGLIAALALPVSGCGSSPPARQPTASHPIACGTTRSAANVAVSIEITAGSVACATARQIEEQYARDIRAGKAPGLGGGGPVKVDGWTCNGFPEPQVVATGKASLCVRGGDRILAVLPAKA